MIGNMPIILKMRETPAYSELYYIYIYIYIYIQYMYVCMYLFIYNIILSNPREYFFL